MKLDSALFSFKLNEQCGEFFGRNSVYEVHLLVPTVIHQPPESNYMSEKSISGGENTSIFTEVTESLRLVS